VSFNLASFKKILNCCRSSLGLIKYKKERKKDSIASVDLDPVRQPNSDPGTGGAVCKVATPSVEQLGGRGFKPWLRSLLD
jgi:hypothetical protein